MFPQQLSEGLDFPHLEVLIFAAPMSAVIDKAGSPAATKLIQSIGRCRRPHPGKTRALIIDLVDKCAFGVSAFNKRRHIYRLQGFGGDLMAINSRTKSASAEREFSSEVYQWAGVKLIRNLEQSRSGGFDLIVHSAETGAMSDSFRALAIECKRYGKVTPGLIAAWWEQARQQAEPCRLFPVLAYRADRAAWRVITPLCLINSALTEDLSLDSTVTMALPAFCAIVREGYPVKRTIKTANRPV